MYSNFIFLNYPSPEPGSWTVSFDRIVAIYTLRNAENLNMFSKHAFMYLLNYLSWQKINFIISML